MKYRITHPESDSKWIVENPKEVDLELWKSQGCSIEEIKERKKALLVGITKLISVPSQVLHLWSCRECGQLFNASMKNIFRIIIYLFNIT